MRTSIADRLRARPAILVAPIVVLALLLASLATALQGLAAPSPQQPQADDPALVRELATRLLGGAGGPQPVKTELFVGRLPRGADIPLPDGARLLGGVTREMPQGKYGGPGTEIVVDIPGAAGEVAASLGATLAPAGWKAASAGHGPVGFVPTAQPVYAMYCKGERWLNAIVSAGEEGLRDVRISINEGQGPCGANVGMTKPMMPPGMDKLPALVAPSGVGITVMGAPGGPERWGSEAVADTALSAKVLEAHYAKQLAAKGWTRVDGGADGPLAWSRWTLEGGWTGFLMVLESSGAKREMSVRVIGPTR